MISAGQRVAFQLSGFLNERYPVKEDYEKSLMALCQHRFFPGGKSIKEKEERIYNNLVIMFRAVLYFKNLSIGQYPKDFYQFVSSNCGLIFQLGIFEEIIDCYVRGRWNFVRGTTDEQKLAAGSDRLARLVDEW